MTAITRSFPTSHRLIEHVRASMKLIETAIAGAAPSGDQEIAANVVVLDDVTPRYVKARAALSACEAGLGVALHVLLDRRTSKNATGKAGCGRFIRLVEPEASRNVCRRDALTRP